MQSFEWIDAQSVEHASSLLSSKNTIAKAGGMDLLDLLKEGILKPTRVVNLKTIPDLNDVSYSEQEGLRIGALVTLSQIAKHAVIGERYAALSAAVNHAATPQIRNAATIGGNLLQRPRCWYYRNEHFHRDDSQAEMSIDENQYHAIFDNAQTALVHASTLATALIAYDATVHLAGPQGATRSIKLQKFLLPASMTKDRDAVIADDEILTHLTVPATDANTHAAYSKQTERDSYDWPIFDIGVVFQMTGPIVRQVRMVLGSVAPTPRRATASEQLLTNKKITPDLAREAAQLAVSDATPLSNNAYKVPMLAAVLHRTILSAVE